MRIPGPPFRSHSQWVWGGTRAVGFLYAPHGSGVSVFLLGPHFKKTGLPNCWLADEAVLRGYYQVFKHRAGGALGWEPNIVRGVGWGWGGRPPSGSACAWHGTGRPQTTVDQ